MSEVETRLQRLEADIKRLIARIEGPGASVSGAGFVGEPRGEQPGFFTFDPKLFKE